MKITPIILTCVVLLAVASSFGFTMLSNMTPQFHTETSLDSHEFTKTAEAQAPRVMGDPVYDPKPN